MSMMASAREFLNALRRVRHLLYIEKNTIEGKYYVFDSRVTHSRVTLGEGTRIQWTPNHVTERGTFYLQLFKKSDTVKSQPVKVPCLIHRNSHTEGIMSPILSPEECSEFDIQCSDFDFVIAPLGHVPCGSSFNLLKTTTSSQKLLTSHCGGFGYSSMLSPNIPSIRNIFSEDFQKGQYSWKSKF
ncbi:hypothetical protein K438DRAFT_1761262 [Mycena galopus ATCC 62051]|nr:hypothetical protein K438DRAFT_1761262 [Mycena galopus ATCC 62051]